MGRCQSTVCPQRVAVLLPQVSRVLQSSGGVQLDPLRIAGVGVMGTAQPGMVYPAMVRLLEKSSDALLKGPSSRLLNHVKEGAPHFVDDVR